MSEFAIETKELTKRYGKVTALDHLNLRVPEGALFGFIGPNGAGKTTTLRLLAGLLDPDEGEIWLAGRRMSDDSREVRRLIGYMPDFFGVYEEMRVWEYLDFYARCYEVPASRRAAIVNDLLALVGLLDKRDDDVNTLSRGMQQRLCLAHTLVHEPQILLLDEPASGLDPRARVEMRELLRELSRMGKTIVISSHILAELAEMCTQIGIIERGQLIISGDMESIRRQMTRERLLHIRVLGDPNAALACLDGYPGIEQAVLIPQGNHSPLIEVPFSGDEQAMAGLLAHLVVSGISVISFQEVGSDLEELFLRLTEAT
jgi:ABC-2 type transport system ATP-binding protein